MSLWSYLARKVGPYIHFPETINKPAFAKLAHESHTIVGIQPGETVTALDLYFSRSVLPFVALDLSELKFGQIKIKIECMYSDGSCAKFAEREVDGADAMLVEERLPICNGIKIVLAMKSGLLTNIRVHTHVLEVSDATLAGSA